MSGTSVDAIDSALVRFGDDGLELIATHEHIIPPEIKTQIAAISHAGDNEIERLGVLDRELGLLFAKATMQLLESANTPPQQVRAIGSPGQTIRHRPPSSASSPSKSFSLQIGDPNTIAENTGVTTVADFRRRDIASGGEGAPLAPGFHAVAFARPNVIRAIINIGGIANATFLVGTDLRMGFDTGPGNTLLDHWILGKRAEPYDCNGQWAATGQVNTVLLDRLLFHPYFKKGGPRSTGKEDFNLPWLEHNLVTMEEIAPEDVQATLVEFTCTSITRAIEQSLLAVSEVYVCGGGAHNTHLMERLQSQLAPATVQSTAAIGIEPDWVEAATFAWLAKQTLEGLPGNSSVVTGAAGLRVLGGIYPGTAWK
jgi:anhydro-N-acetylmuramic acid kinase